MSVKFKMVDATVSMESVLITMVPIIVSVIVDIS